MRKAMALNALVISLGLICGPLAAQESTMLTPMQSNGTSYLSGGVGDAELLQLKQASKDFNLKLLMAERSGSFAANVKVSITNAKGKNVLEVPSAGPLLLAKLPAGAYRVSATYEGKEQQKRVNVYTGRQQALNFSW